MSDLLRTNIEMRESELRVIKRILQEMLTLGMQSHDNPLAFGTFKGAAIALAILFEEYTGADARFKSPKEIMHWAVDLKTPNNEMYRSVIQ